LVLLSCAGASAACTVEASNIGNVGLTSVALATDEEAGYSSNCRANLLLPGAKLTCNVSRLASQEDFDAGTLSIAPSAATAMPRVTAAKPLRVPITSVPVPLKQTTAMDVNIATELSPAVVSNAGGFGNWVACASYCMQGVSAWHCRQWHSLETACGDRMVLWLNLAAGDAK
jgi:hypothetical protein